VVRLYSVSPGKISVIPHGDYKFFLPDRQLKKEEAKANLGIPTSSKTLLFFGAIRPNKGLGNLLKALPLVKKRVPGVKLLIAGEPCESYAKYREIIESEEIRESVHEKLDYISHDDVSVYFTAADIVVLPYNEITQSGVLQIALAFGKPVVVSALGGFKEAVEHGGNGYLVEAGDKESLAAGIVDILRNEKTIERMGRRSRYLSDANYSWDSIGERTIDVYVKILRENRL
jgi:glycosyltransferase involved in cell wall biosynthesis